MEQRAVTVSMDHPGYSLISKAICSLTCPSEIAKVSHCFGDSVFASVGIFTYEELPRPLRNRRQSRRHSFATRLDDHLAGITTQVHKKKRKQLQETA
jgi:hypothetical protein